MPLKSLLTRVRTIEKQRAGAVEATDYWERLTAALQAGISDGRYEAREMQTVIQRIRTWAAEGLLRLPKG